MIIVTAAGHGGSDPGAPNPYNPGLPEKAMNLAIDGLIAAIAVANGHQAYRVRTTDTDYSYAQIPALAKQVGANAVFEIHCDSLGTTARGCHAIALPASQSQYLGQAIVDRIAYNTGIPSRGTADHWWKDGSVPVYVVNVSRFVELSDRLHMLVENGFISNEQDEYALEHNTAMVAYSYIEALHTYWHLPAPVMAVSQMNMLPMLVVGGTIALGYYVYKH